jgi:hypothetical protein
MTILIYLISKYLVYLTAQSKSWLSIYKMELSGGICSVVCGPNLATNSAY